MIVLDFNTRCIELSVLTDQLCGRNCHYILSRWQWVSKKRDKLRQKRRLQLEVDPGIKEDLKALSDELGIPQSQIVALFILHGLDGIRSGEIDLAKYVESSGSPQLWKWNINLERFKRDKHKK